MIYASFIYGSVQKNKCFETKEPYSPYTKLRNKFLEVGIELNTPDLNRGRPIAFEFHLNAQRRTPQARAYVHLAENPLIRPLNRQIRVLKKYRKWFTWDEHLFGNPQAQQIFLPNRLDFKLFTTPESRPLFLVLVAANKALVKKDSRDQYLLRQEIISWYELNRTKDFYLYGQGWNQPFVLPGKLGRFRGQFWKYLNKLFPVKPKLKTWYGVAKDKFELLQKARFCIAHENCRDIPGYITEKIFDCFRAGCVPVYIGPREIHSFIPKECFIDGGRFNNPAEMDTFLRSIDDETYRGYQASIKEFLISEKAIPFSQEYFVQTIVQTVLSDLSLNKS